eukprot:scaffold43853_cov59-Phaeocystis_antarctica.AAC.2
MRTRSASERGTREACTILLMLSSRSISLPRSTLAVVRRVVPSGTLSARPTLLPWLRRRLTASPSWARTSISSALCGRAACACRHALRRGLALLLARVTLLESGVGVASMMRGE